MFYRHVQQLIWCWDNFSIQRQKSTNCHHHHHLKQSPETLSSMIATDACCDDGCSFIRCHQPWNLGVGAFTVGSEIRRQTQSKRSTRGRLQCKALSGVFEMVATNTLLRDIVVTFFNLFAALFLTQIFSALAAAGLKQVIKRQWMLKTYIWDGNESWKYKFESTYCEVNALKLNYS